MLGLPPIIKNKPGGETILRPVGFCLSALLAATSAFSPAWAESFDTRLSPSPLTDGTRVNVTGEGQALVEWDGNILSVSGNFAGLASDATTAELYDGQGIGIP